MTRFLRRFLATFSIVSFVVVLPFIGHAKPAVAKSSVYKGAGIQLTTPNGWTASNDAKILKQLDQVLANFFSKVKTYVYLSNPTYGTRAVLIVLSDPETKKNGKTLTVEQYVKMGIEGLPPELQLGDGKLKKLKVAGSPAIQWGFRLSADSNEFRFTTLIKNGIAYSLYLESEKGLYIKDKKLQAAYATLQKTFALTAKAKKK